MYGPAPKEKDIFFYEHKEGVRFKVLEKEHLKTLKDTKTTSWMYTHGFLIPTDKSQLEWFEKLEKSDTDLVLVGMIYLDINDSIICNDKRICGEGNKLVTFSFGTFYNIDHYNRCLQIGGHILPEYRGKGYTLKAWYAGIDFAFEMLNMNRIYGEVLETNTKALKLDEMTMRKEGVKKQAVYQSGRYLDSVMFGLLREEWANSDRVKSYGGICNTQVENAV